MRSLALKQSSRTHYEAHRARALRQRSRGLAAVVRALLSPAQLIAAALVLPTPRRMLAQKFSAIPWPQINLPIVPKLGHLMPSTSMLPSRDGALISSQSSGQSTQTNAAPPQQRRRGGFDLANLPGRRKQAQLESTRDDGSGEGGVPPPPPRPVWLRSLVDPIIGFYARLFSVLRPRDSPS